MARQNRVTPYSSIIATPARGTLMGNRGCLHDVQGRIRRLYTTRRWIICRLDFKNRQRVVMMPGRYTELFFLDEATALAAGHRPCAECMRQRYKQFLSFWIEANPALAGGPAITAEWLDKQLHQERLGLYGQKLTHPAPLEELPDGTFVSLEADGPPYLVLEDKLLLWLPEGYGQAIPRPEKARIQLLTPPSVVRALAQGYRAELHPSAYRVGLRPIY